jgi:hypothetical protein
VIENDLEQPMDDNWKYFSSIATWNDQYQWFFFPPFFCHPWMIQKWSLPSMGNRFTKSWRKECVGPIMMASKNIKIHYGVYVDDVGPFVFGDKRTNSPLKIDPCLCRITPSKSTESFGVYIY